MLLEEVMIHTYARNISPSGLRDRAGVHVIYPRERNGEDERGVGRDDELTSVESCHAKDELAKLNLQLGGQ